MVKQIFTACVLGIMVSAAWAASPIGWRTDGTGRYPSAEPVTEWGPEKNIAWKCPMPSWSNSTPVIVGDKIFVCSEPTDLVCVSKADGKILWKKSNGYDIVMTAEEKAQAEKDKAEIARIRKEELAPLQKQMNDAQAEVRKLTPPKPSTQPTSTPASLPSDEQKAALAEAQKKVKDINTQIGAVNAKITPLSKWEMPGTEGSNGHSSASPVSDGKFVAVVFNNGVAACYDLDGNLKWARFIDKPPHKDWGSCSSPLIFQDRLLVHFVNMVALDLQTGKEVWKAPNTEWHWGTPIITRVGEVDVVVTAAGDIIRLSDGKVLVKKLCPLEYAAPIVVDGVAYFIQGGGKAFKLAAKDAEEVEAKPLWTTKPKQDRYYASPLFNDNLIYAVTQAKHFSVIDPADGKVLADKDLDVGKQTVYSSITLGGKYLFVSNEDGTTLVLELGKDIKEVSRNTLEKFRCCPVFEGKRMYIRGYKNLYCIGQ